MSGFQHNVTKHAKKINKSKSQFFEWVNAVNKSVAILTKEKRRYKLPVSGIKEELSVLIPQTLKG